MTKGGRNVILLGIIVVVLILICSIVFIQLDSAEVIHHKDAADPLKSSDSDPHSGDRERVALNCINDTKDAANCGNFAATVWPFPQSTQPVPETAENTSDDSDVLVTTGKGVVGTIDK